MAPRLLRDGWSRHVVDRVRGGVVKTDVFPGIKRSAQRLAGLSGVRENLRPFGFYVAPFVASENHGLERDPIGGSTGLDAHRVPDRAAAELQHAVLAEIIDKLMHLSCMNAAGCNRHDFARARPLLIKEQAVR